MHRLIEKGLMFGNLIRVDSPALVERYNRALKHLTGRETALDGSISIFRAISPRSAMSLAITFTSTSRGQPAVHPADDRAGDRAAAECEVLDLARDPAAVHRARTSRAVCADRPGCGGGRDGEFGLSWPIRPRGCSISAGSRWRPTPPAARSPRRRKLAALIDRFKTERMRWYDDVLIAEMIGMAKKTGDVTRNPVKLRQMAFEQGNFWTAHFGGIYIFRGVEHPAAIVAAQQGKMWASCRSPSPLISRTVRDCEVPELNDLVEPIIEARGVDAAAILHQKMDFILAAVAADR